MPKKGYKQTLEHIKKVCETRKGLLREGKITTGFKKGHKFSLECLSEEHKRKIGLANSIALKGRKLSEEHRKKVIKNLVNNAMKGKHHSEESKRKMSLSHKGKRPKNFQDFFNKRHEFRKEN